MLLWYYLISTLQRRCWDARCQVNYRIPSFLSHIREDEHVDYGGTSRVLRIIAVERRDRDGYRDRDGKVGR